MADVYEKRGVPMWWWIFGFLALVLIIWFLVVFLGEDPDVVETEEFPAAVEPAAPPTEPEPVMQPEIVP